MSKKIDAKWKCLCGHVHNITIRKPTLIRPSRYMTECEECASKYETKFSRVPGNPAALEVDPRPNVLSSAAYKKQLSLFRKNQPWITRARNFIKRMYG